MSHIHTIVAYSAAFDAMLFKAPIRAVEGVPGRTAAELVDLLGSKPDTVHLHLHALHSEGLVYTSGHTATGAQIHAWQPGIACLMPDHVRVVGPAQRARKRLQKRIQHDLLELAWIGALPSET